MTKRLDPHPFRCSPRCPAVPEARHAPSGMKTLSFRRVIPGHGAMPREPRNPYERRPRRNGSGVGVHDFRARPKGRPGMTSLL